MTQPPDWDALRDEADRGQSLDALARALNLAWVATTKLGVELRADGRRLVGRCPLHDDSDPSFAIWVGDDGKQRWGCWSCPSPTAGAWGDVLDLIARWKRCGVAAAIGYARMFLREYEYAGHPDVAPTIVEEAPRELAEGARAWYARSRLDPTGVANGLLKLAVTRRWPWLANATTAEVVTRAFELGYGSESHTLIAPHFDEAGSLVALKTRDVTRNEPWRAVAGSRLRGWYRATRSDPHRKSTLIVVEGETDAWAAYLASFGTGDAIALPAGVASAVRIDLTPLMSARRIVLALDGDKAGQTATGHLYARLRQAGVGDGAIVILRVGPGADVASRGPTWLRDELGRRV